MQLSTDAHEREMSKSDSHKQNRDSNHGDRGNRNIPSRSRSLELWYAPIRGVATIFFTKILMIRRNILRKLRSFSDSVDPDDPLFNFHDDLDTTDELPASAQTNARKENDLVDEWDGAEVAATRSAADLNRRNGPQNE